MEKVKNGGGGSQIALKTDGEVCTKISKVKGSFDCHENDFD